MRVQPRHVALGAAAVVCFAVVPALVALRGRGEAGLVVELVAEPSLAILDGGAISAVLHGHETVAFSVDGQPQKLEGRRVEVATGDLGPGLHVARLVTSSSASTHEGQPLWERTVALGFLQGPFEDPATWHDCAAKLHVGQAFLEKFADRALSRQLSELLAKEAEMPPLKSARVSLTWAGDGVDCVGMVEFASGKDLQLGGHVHIWVDDRHELHLARVGEVTVTGSQLAVWRSEGRRKGAEVGALIGAKRGALWGLLGGPLGEIVGVSVGAVLGRGKGEQIGAERADAQVKESVTATVDDEGIGALEQMLRLPPAFQVKGGIDVRLRYCEALELEPGRRLSLGFDVQTTIPAKGQVDPLGLPTRLSKEPPLAAGQAPAFVFDASPALLDGLLDSWWRSGQLTLLMNEKRWLDSINRGPNSDKLDIEIEHVEPLLPPSLEILAGAAAVRTAETRLTLIAKGQAGGKRQPPRDARLFADVHVVPHYGAEKQELDLDWQLSELGATCHDPDAASGHVLLRPCYSDLLRIVQEHAFAVPNPSVAQTLSLPLHQLLFEGDAKRGLPYLLAHLTHIEPSILDSHGEPWVRITADAWL